MLIHHDVTKLASFACWGVLSHYLHGPALQLRTCSGVMDAALFRFITTKNGATFARSMSQTCKADTANQNLALCCWANQELSIETMAKAWLYWLIQTGWRPNKASCAVTCLIGCRAVCLKARSDAQCACRGNVLQFFNIVTSMLSSHTCSKSISKDSYCILFY